MIMKYFLCAIFLAGVMAPNPLGFILAAPAKDLVINEIAWMGTEIQGVEAKNWWRYEWFELYNNTDKPIPLAGWKVELYRTDLDWSLELQGIIQANGYFFVVSSDKVSINYDLNYSNLSGKFINSGQRIVLKSSEGQVVDEINCLSGWFAGDNSTKQTMERKNSSAASDSVNWQNSQNPGGTPKYKNSSSAGITLAPPPEETPKQLPEQQEPQPEPKSDGSLPQETAQPQTEPLVYPSLIVINEFLPSPDGPDESEEWIELKNLNSAEVDLSGWKIQDTIGSVETYAFPEGTKIPLKGFLVISRPISKITLNNKGDGLNLLWPDGTLKDNVVYENSFLGQSFNRFGSEWAWSSALSPGSENVIPPKSSKTVGETPAKTKLAKNPSLLTEESVPESQKELASVGGLILQPFNSLFALLAAIFIAILSGIIILILKKNLKREL